MFASESEAVAAAAKLWQVPPASFWDWTGRVYVPALAQRQVVATLRTQLGRKKAGAIVRKLKVQRHVPSSVSLFLQKSKAKTRT